MASILVISLRIRLKLIPVEEEGQVIYGGYIAVLLNQDRVPPLYKLRESTSEEALAALAGGRIKDIIAKSSLTPPPRWMKPNLPRSVLE